jgi:hypothetical protein
MNARLDQLDVLAGRAAADLRATTDADAELGLPRVYDAQTRHRSRGRLLVAATVIGALGVGWLARGVAAHDDTAPVGPPSTPVHNVPQPSLCQQDRVTCLGHRTYRFDLVTTLLWQLPEPFAPDFGTGPTPDSVEEYWSHRGNVAGVSVVEGVAPARPDGDGVRGLGSRPTPRAFAEWLAARPFLDATTPVRTSVDGRTAWRVRARLASDAAQGLGTCAQADPCHPVTRVATGSITGIWGDMIADYTFVRLPSGTAVVWSWAFGHDTGALDHNRALVDGISWPTD